MVSGHQPHGDCPTVIRSGAITVITADTSYSQMGHKSSWGVDNRGVHAVSEVILYRDGSSEVHGILAAGTTAPGLLWEEAGLEKPIGNEDKHEIHSKTLVQALKNKASKALSKTVVLSQDEFDRWKQDESEGFKVSNLTYDSYIQVDQKYYRPAATKIAYKLGVGGDKFVGRQLSDDSWVKARCIHISASILVL